MDILFIVSLKVTTSVSKQQHRAETVVLINLQSNNCMNGMNELMNKLLQNMIISGETEPKLWNYHLTKTFRVTWWCIS